MSTLDDLIERDPLLAAEVATLTTEQRRWLVDDQAIRERAAQLAAELALDESEIYHQLKHLRRSPIERLRLGLAHGRRRPRSAE